MEVKVIVLEVPGLIAVIVPTIPRRGVQAIDQRPCSGDFVVRKGPGWSAAGNRLPTMRLFATGRSHRVRRHRAELASRTDEKGGAMKGGDGEGGRARTEVQRTTGREKAVRGKQEGSSGNARRFLRGAGMVR